LSTREKEEALHFLLFLVVGVIAGAAAGRIVPGRGHGVLGDMVIGITGGFVGGWLFATVFGVAGGGFVMSLFSAFIGGVVLLWVIRLLVPTRV
jgi:uncharacterized membrane protein YeaQ/YmgE (transglycosylase-associated protein family)